MWRPGGEVQAACPASTALLPMSMSESSNLRSGLACHPVAGAGQPLETQGALGHRARQASPRSPGTANGLSAWSGVTWRRQRETPRSQALGHMLFACVTWGRGGHGAAGRVWGQLGLLSWQGFQAPHVAGIAARCVLVSWRLGEG